MWKNYLVRGTVTVTGKRKRFGKGLVDYSNSYSFSRCNFIALCEKDALCNARSMFDKEEKRTLRYLQRSSKPYSHPYSFTFLDRFYTLSHVKLLTESIRVSYRIDSWKEIIDYKETSFERAAEDLSMQQLRDIWFSE